MKTGSILIDFDMIFPMQLSELIKSVNVEGNLKNKTTKKNVQIQFFT